MPSNSARLPFFTPFEKGAAWPLGTQTGAGLLRQGRRLSRALAVLEITGNPYIRMSAKGQKQTLLPCTFYVRFWGHSGHQN